MFEGPWRRSFLYVFSVYFFFTENYTEIFHVCKGNVPSFQCKISIAWSASMGEVDGMNLILIDLYISASKRHTHTHKHTYIYSLFVAYIRWCSELDTARTNSHKNEYVEFIHC